MTIFEPGQWILIGGGGPFLPRLTLDQDEYCLQGRGNLNTATPGDSVDLEFWFTPADTAVADTIRGTFKAWYRGDILPADWVPVHPRDPVPSIRWTRAGLRSSAPIPGPAQLVDLRGRICPLRAVPSAEGALLVPARPLAPGVYHLSWPQGSTTVLIPEE